MHEDRKFREGDRVEWTDADGVKNTGRIIEYSWCYDPRTISNRYNYLVKNDKGGYNNLEEHELKKLDI